MTKKSEKSEEMKSEETKVEAPKKKTPVRDEVFFDELGDSHVRVYFDDDSVEEHRL